MDFKAVCIADEQNAAGTHLVTLRDEASGHEIKLLSPLKVEKGETFAVSIKPQPKPAPKPPIEKGETLPPIDKFDAQPDEAKEHASTATD